MTKKRNLFVSTLNIFNDMFCLKNGKIGELDQKVEWKLFLRKEILLNICLYDALSETCTSSLENSKSVWGK